jgi:hypothetical protein
MTWRTIEVAPAAEVRRVGWIVEEGAEAAAVGAAPDSADAVSPSVIVVESAIDSIIDEGADMEEGVAAGVVGVVEAATAGVEGGDGDVIGVGFGVSSSDAANLSFDPSDATTRNP